MTEKYITLFQQQVGQKIYFVVHRSAIRRISSVSNRLNMDDLFQWCAKMVLAVH